VKSSRTQAGSAHVAIVIVLVVIILGLVGFVFWQNFINKTSTVASTKTATTSSGSTTISADSVKQTANELYTVYSKSGSCNADNADYVSCLAGEVQPYITTKLQTALENYLPTAGSSSDDDPILCTVAGGAGPVPTYAVGDAVNITTQGATGVVNMTYPTDSSLAGTYSINFTAVSQSGTIKLDTVTCPTFPKS
jgi:uncharacterized protein (UPF0333 family)